MGEPRWRLCFQCCTDSVIILSEYEKDALKGSNFDFDALNMYPLI